MKKIVLIEDRFKRQELFISETNFDFEKYSDIVDNIILDDFYPLANEIINNNFDLSQYEIIICHKSVQLENKNESNSIITSRLIEYCKNNNKTYILLFYPHSVTVLPALFV